MTESLIAMMRAHADLMERQDQEAAGSNPWLRDKTTGKQVATFNADGFNMLPIGDKLWVHNGEELRIYETAQ